jgi:hypothetical protein
VPTAVPIAHSVTWTVHDGDTQLKEGEDFLAPSGLQGASLPITLLPGIVEDTGDGAGPVQTVKLRATVTLSAGSLSETRQLAPVDLPRPVLRLPAVLALFVHRDFAPVEPRGLGLARWLEDGPALVVLPEGTPLSDRERTLSELLKLLNVVRSAASPLTAFPIFGLFLPVLDTLIQALRGNTFVTVEAANSIRELRNIVLKPGGALWIGTISAADEFSSLIFIGPPGKRAQLFNSPGATATDAPTFEGQLDVTAPPSLGVMIPNLHSATPTGEPAGGATAVFPPSGGLKIPGGFINTFGDEISSLRFG